MTFWILVLKDWMKIGKSKRNPDKHKKSEGSGKPTKEWNCSRDNLFTLETIQECKLKKEIVKDNDSQEKNGALLLLSG